MNRMRLVSVALVALAAVIAATMTIVYLLFPPVPRPAHEPWLMPNTALRIVLQPSRAQHYITKLAPTATRFIKGVPRLSSTQGRALRIDWIHALPHEMTLLVARPRPEELRVRLVVRERPESESMAAVLNHSGFFRALRFAAWDRARLVPENGHFLAAQGRVALPTHVPPLEQRFPPPELDTGHLFEIAGTNRGGVPALFHEELVRTYGAYAGQDAHEAVQWSLDGVRRFRFTADLAAPDTLGLRLEIACSGARGLQAAAEAAHLVEEAVRARLLDEEGFRLEGAAAPVSETELRATYTLTGFEPQLSRALGN
mgnify:CR=1 FL=1